MLLIFLGAGIASPQPDDPRGRAGGSTELLSAGGVGDMLLSGGGVENDALSSGGADNE